MLWRPFFPGGCAVVLQLFAPLALAQMEEPEIIVHHEGLDIEVQPMGKPTLTLDGDLLGVRAVKVLNRGDRTVVCAFHVPQEIRASSPPVPFRVDPGGQAMERVPGDYAPGQPYAELTCRGTP